jgi:exodeoxyribonuclease-3
MAFRVTTWNINSVRLRIGLVAEFLKIQQPDVLCLQETKTPDAHFPEAAFRALGYHHIARLGEKGYNGVAIIARHAFAEQTSAFFCGREDARQISARMVEGPASGLAIHNFYVPAGGDIPDTTLNIKFAHKLQFVEEMRQWSERLAARQIPSLLVGDLNIAPLEHDVWSHKQLLDVVSHTPVETEALERLRSETDWVDAARHRHPEPEKVYTWWSYRSPDWQAANKGRRLDHIWLTRNLVPNLSGFDIFKAARGWERPSDHVPVTVTLDV